MMRPPIASRLLARCLLTTCLLALGTGAALAHGPTPQRASQSITIAAKPDAVWKVAGDFAGIATWNPAVAKGEGSGGNAGGGKRKLVLKNGGTLAESLDEWDAKALSYSYRLDEADLKALPVSSYSGTLTVSPEGEGSKVEWKARFYRGDTGNEPPENLSDAAGKVALDAYFSDGLNGLKAQIEGKATQ